MPKQKTPKAPLRILICLALFWAMTSTPAPAMAGPAPLIEAPAAPLAGAFVVNSPLDTNALDSVLTLREAILVANGTLIGDFSPSEQAQLSGCVFNGSGFITGGCGPGITDTISFSSSVVITLTSALPAITDTRGTIIRGCDVEPCAVIESGSIAANTDALTVNGADNQIWDLQIQRSPRDGIRVNGDANALNFLKVYSSADNGVRINGDNNRIFEGYFGFSPADSGQNCHPNRTGILIANGGTGNQVRAALVGCSIQAGIQISGSNLNTIMDDTFVGWRFPVARPNGIGILINNGSFRNEISQTLVAYNLGNGIEIRGANGTSILDSDFLYNGRNGIAIYNASFTSVGGRYLDNNSVNGNEIGGNTRSGIVISGTANANVVLGNQIGARSGTNNGDAGVLITDGAYQNTVGGLRNGPLALGRGGNTIGGNTIGVHLRAGANNNTVWGNDIGRSAGETSPVLNTTGILIEDGVYNTFLGSSSAANYHNVIAGNGTGVVISDANRAFLYGNIIGISPTLGNLGTGLVLHRAVTNTLFENALSWNGGDGARLEAGANSNDIEANTVIGNDGNGFALISSTLNVISGTVIAANAGDGIRVNTGAEVNFWNRLSVYNNGGLGIDKQANIDGTHIPNPPTATIKSVNRATGVVTGTATGSVLFILTSVQLYRLALDPSGYGEGAQYVGSDVTDSDGNWSITDTNAVLRQVGCYTVLVDVAVLVPLGTSEFGRNNCRGIVFAPRVLR